MFSREQIDQIRSAVNIVELIRAYVPSLNVQGRSVKGLCPFHNERTPSFHVHPEKGFFKCFGCGEAGDAIAFVSKLEQVSFSEAVEKLAADAGIELKKSVRVKPEQEDLKDKIYRVLDAARQFYSEQLWDAGIGEPARKYLADRGITDRTAEKFELGYAAANVTPCFEALVKRNFPIELCQQAGLVQRSAAGRFYDPQFGRLTFPIFDSFGRCVGFGGRILPSTRKALPGLQADVDEGPKYLNSPETPVFSKGKLLYGLNQAKPHILSARRAVVMEGYMDVIGVHQGGLETAVATLGTALTRDHAKLLKRYADEVVAFFDPDEAGQKATMRGIEPLLQELIYPRVVVPGDDSDPDELILAKGREFVEQMIATSPDFVDFILSRSPVKATSSALEKSQLAAQMVALIRNSPNEILKSEWISKVASGLGLNAESLFRELAKSSGVVANEAAKPQVAKPKGRALPSIDDEMLQLFYKSPVVMEEDAVDESDFDEERHRRLFTLMRKQWSETKSLSFSAIHDQVSENEKQWMIDLLLEDKEYDDVTERKEQLFKAFGLKKDRRRLAGLTAQIAQGNVEAAVAAEYQTLLKRVKGFSISK